MEYRVEEIRAQERARGRDEHTRRGTTPRRGLVTALALTALSLLASDVSGTQATGTISGVITTSAAGLPPARVTVDQAVCGNAVADETIVRDAAGHLANVVVTLVGVKGSHPPAAGVMNEKCRFSPHVQIVQPDARITTSSADAMLHTTHAQTTDGATIFNVALPVPGIRITKQVGAGLIRLSCNSHPWMHGWIVATNDMAAISGRDGTFTLSNVPVGTYDLRIWHESLAGTTRKVTVTAGGTTRVDVALK